MQGPLDSKRPPRRGYVLLDRDGTINRECHFLSDPDAVELLPGTVAGMRKLAALGFGLIVITNQSGIGRGYFDQQQLDQVHQRLIELLEQEGIRLDGIYYCPDHPDAGTRRRKPQPGMVEEAARDFGFDPATIYVAGDRPCDVAMGNAVGATTFLLRTGYGRETEQAGTASPDYIADDLDGMAEMLSQIVVQAAG